MFRFYTSKARRLGNDYKCIILDRFRRLMKVVKSNDLIKQGEYEVFEGKEYEVVLHGKVTVTEDKLVNREKKYLVLEKSENGSASVVMSLDIQAPEYHFIGHMYNREAVYLRDNCTCQLCPEGVVSMALSIDHVSPAASRLYRSSNYYNCVAACEYCNLIKADKPLECSNFELRSTPRPPYAKVLWGFRFSDATLVTVKDICIPIQWMSYALQPDFIPRSIDVTEWVDVHLHELERYEDFDIDLLRSCGSHHKAVLEAMTELEYESKSVQDLVPSQIQPSVNEESTLALCRAMIADVDICHRNIEFLVKIVQTSSSDLERMICMRTVGYLHFSHPDLSFDRWIPHVFRCLHDPSFMVRETALHVISRLIVKEKIKVDGHLYQIAALLSDEDESTSILARRFFHHFTTVLGRGRLFDIFPDFVRDCLDLDEKSFKFAIWFLIGRIRIEKVNRVMLVEKLCHRFSGEDIKIWEHVSYPVSLLVVDVDSMDKFIDSFAAYRHALSHEPVYSNFQRCMIKVKDLANSELQCSKGDLDVNFQIIGRIEWLEGVMDVHRRAGKRK